ncbi:hypothetical protein ACIQUX_25500 [Streptomyces sp. NPDC101133]|uniref:MmyB family transcriptional regulator n=1 Tax=Streptomyces sp. NPDC101133 TaxID=3366111 RepID=UPI00382E3641
MSSATPHTTDRKTIRHPEVGDILLDCDVLIVPGADLRMVTYTAATGGSNVGKLDPLRVTGGRGTATVPPLSSPGQRPPQRPAWSRAVRSSRRSARPAAPGRRRGPTTVTPGDRRLLPYPLPRPAGRPANSGPGPARAVRRERRR